MKSMIKFNMVVELESIKYVTQKKNGDPMAEMFVLAEIPTKNGEMTNRLKILVFNPFVKVLQRMDAAPGDILNISCHFRNKIAGDYRDNEIILSGPDSSLIITSKKHPPKNEMHTL